MRRRASNLRAAGLGAAIAMSLSADPIGYFTAATMVASLIAVGIVDLVRLDHRRLRIRVWWERHRRLVILCDGRRDRILDRADDGVFRQPLVPLLDYNIHAAFAPSLIAYHRAIHRIVPILMFYEFLVVALGASAWSRLSRGVSVIVSRRGRWCGRSSASRCLRSLGENSAEAVVAIIAADGVSSALLRSSGCIGRSTGTRFAMRLRRRSR